MDIKKWEQLKQEFKGDAFKFVQENWKTKGLQPLYFKSNDEVDAALKEGVIVDLKPISELFEMDIQVYGDNAYLMWESPYTEKDRNPNSLTAEFFKLNPALMHRKTSAALPFDLERAKAGDVVEYFYNNRWWGVNFVRLHKITNKIVISFLGNEPIVFCEELRMKYPPKAKK